jgi:hypothetical protein
LNGLNDLNAIAMEPLEHLERLGVTP